jgi:heat shock protein 1/8
VSAVEKTGKSQRITITNDKGRLSSEQIEKMVADAEKYKDNRRQKDRIETKNHLENYAYTIRTSLQDGTVSSKLNPDDKTKLNSAVDATLSSMDTHQSASKENLNRNRTNLNQPLCQLWQNWYRWNGWSSSMGGDPSGSKTSKGPTVDDVD